MTSAGYEQLVEFLERQFTGIDRRCDEVNGQITELRHDMLGHFDEIYRRRERLEQEYHTITQALRRVEAGLADGRGRREALERDLAALKRHAAALQSGIEEIEQRLGRQRPASPAPIRSPRCGRVPPGPSGPGQGGQTSRPRADGGQTGCRAGCARLGLSAS